jgi:hypothetical protein
VDSKNGSSETLGISRKPEHLWLVSKHVLSGRFCLCVAGLAGSAFEPAVVVETYFQGASHECPRRPLKNGCLVLTNSTPVGNESLASRPELLTSEPYKLQDDKET